MYAGWAMSEKHVVFERGPWWLGVFLAVILVQSIAGNLVASVWDLGPDVPVLGFNLLVVFIELALIGVIWWFMRQDGVAFAEIGLSATLIGPALVTVTAFYLILNSVVIGLGLLVAGPAVSGYQWTVPPTHAVGWFGIQLAIAAVVEELAFRGYIQSKVITLIGSETRVGLGIGIVVQSALFAAIHVPRVLTSGVPDTQTLAGFGGLLFLSGLGYGILYELTQNLYIPILVHAAGNMPGTLGIVFFDLGGFPPWMRTVYPLVYLALFAIIIAVYRQRAFDAGQLPVWSTRQYRGDRTTT